MVYYDDFIMLFYSVEYCICQFYWASTIASQICPNCELFWPDHIHWEWNMFELKLNCFFCCVNMLNVSLGLNRLEFKSRWNILWFNADKFIAFCILHLMYSKVYWNAFVCENSAHLLFTQESVRYGEYHWDMDTAPKSSRENHVKEQTGIEHMATEEEKHD